MKSTAFFDRIRSVFVLLTVPAALHCQPRVSTGADVLVAEHLDLLKGKRVGLITNHTGRVSSGEFLVDVLLGKKINVVALFGPEHGIRGEAAAGDAVDDGVDDQTGIAVYSLYGATRKPTPTMLEGVDILMYDIQDVGVRFYTYISTMGLAMEAAAEHGIPFVVVDRPNPIGGLKLDGPVLIDSLRSFVGMYPIPVAYGLTCGELAVMIKSEGWLDLAKLDLTVIWMEGWKRTMLWDDTGCPWVRPSPNIPTPATALVYPATCFIEATNVSEGRGTERPFHFIGAPFIDGGTLSGKLNALRLPGVRFSPTEFTPQSSKFKGQRCFGVNVEVTDFSIFKPFLTGLHLLYELHRSYPENLRFSPSSLARLSGRADILGMILDGKTPEEISFVCEDSIRVYRRMVARFQVYPGN